MTAVVSAFYWVIAVGAGLLIGGAAFLEMFGSEGARATFTIGVPVAVESGGADLPATWNGRTGTVGLDYTSASLEVPLSLAPPSFRAVTYGATLVQMAIVMACLHMLRALFRRVRDGAPFDPRNRTALRWMGGLLIVGHVLSTMFGAWQAAAVLPVVGPSSVALGPPSAVDERVLFAFEEWIVLAGCLVFALGEAFRHGAELEHEQSLVV